MTEETCAACRFYSLAYRPGLGQCRRNPPVVLPFEWDMSAHSAEPIPQVASYTVFPVVDEEDWCGAFEQRRNAEGLSEPVKEADIPLQIG